MNRNVAIVIIILVVVVIAGYLIWLRNRVAQPVTPTVEPTVMVSPSAAPASASPSASPKVATPSAKQKTSTPSSVSK